MRVLVVDDERPARERLRRFLQPLARVEVIGEAGDGVSALQSIVRDRPDAVFLDVQMPVLTGFDVLSQLSDHHPMVVFVTAYDEYALRAFEVSAVDYLLKPVEEDRVEKAVARLHAHDARNAVAQLLARQPLQRIVGTRLGTLHVLPIDTIEAFVAEDTLVFAVTATGRYAVRMTLRELLVRLDPTQYARVHKRVVLNLGALAVLEPISRAGAVARLNSGRTVPISRRYARELRGALGW